jgi:hypothetical protein
MYDILPIGNWGDVFIIINKTYKYFNKVTWAVFLGLEKCIFAIYSRKEITYYRFLHNDKIIYIPEGHARYVKKRLKIKQWSRSLL